MSLPQDLKIGVRVARRRWPLTLTVVATLGLGTGAVTAVLPAVDSLLVKKLPYPEPGRLALVVVRMQGRGASGERINIDGLEWLTLRDKMTCASGAPFSDWVTGVNLSTGNGAVYVKQQRVGAGFFETLGVRPALGRTFRTEEDRNGGPPVVILSDGLWKRAFDGDPTIIGRRVLLKGEPHTVIGIMPRGFKTSVVAEVWTPLKPSTEGEGEGSNYAALLRLKPDVTWAQARQQAASVGQEILNRHSNETGTRSQFGLVDLREGETREDRQPLLVVWSAVLLVWLLGCLNAGGVLLSQSYARRAEVATRYALGASRAAIARQVLAESIVYGGLSAILGWAVGRGALAALKWQGTAVFAWLEEIDLDPRALLACGVLAVAAALLAGLWPVLRASRVDLREVHAGKGISGGGRAAGLGALAGAQVALAVPLLTAAIILAGSWAGLWNRDPGFDPADVSAATFSLQDARYSTAQAVNSLARRGVERLRRIPGVTAAGMGLNLPFERPLNLGYRMQGQTSGEITALIYVTPGYFEALGVTLKQGRRIEERDTETSEPVAVVNESFAKRWGGDVLGKTIRTAGQTRQIVGVVGDVEQIPSWGANAPVTRQRMIYVPVVQVKADLLNLVHTWFAPSWVVRGRAGDAALGKAIQAALEEVDPELPVASVKRLQDVKQAALALPGLLGTLAAGLSALALVLCAAGLFGLMANTVSARTRELGIRMALGSTPVAAVRSALRASALWIAGGLAGGAVLALVTREGLKKLVWGVQPGDPRALVLAALLLLAAALVAAAPSALRVARLDPARTLREE
jgi:predicted permease